jgi:hypothetical protein
MGKNKLKAIWEFIKIQSIFFMEFDSFGNSSAKTLWFSINYTNIINVIFFNNSYIQSINKPIINEDSSNIMPKFLIYVWSGFTKHLFELEKLKQL